MQQGNNWEPVVKFRVLGEPKSRGSKFAITNKRTGKPLLLDSSRKSTDWMSLVSFAAYEAWGTDWLLTGPLALSIVFFFKRRANQYGTGKKTKNVLKASAPIYHSQMPDLAKLVRGVEDAITGVIWRDDSQVCEYLPPMRRVWTEAAEGASVTIWEPGEERETERWN